MQFVTDNLLANQSDATSAGIRLKPRLTRQLADSFAPETPVPELSATGPNIPFRRLLGVSEWSGPSQAGYLPVGTVAKRLSSGLNHSW